MKLILRFGIAASLSILFALTFIYFNNISQNENLVVQEFEDEEDERRTQLDRADYDFRLLRNPYTNEIPKEDVLKSIKAAQNVAPFNFQNFDETKTLPAIGVDVRGPSNLGGRTRALTPDTRNQQIIIAGGVSGGIFRTTNGGDSWTSVTPAGQIHNVSTIVQSQFNKDTWYVGGGEQLSNSASGAEATYLGNGVWKSTDNGITWTLLPSTTGTLESLDSPFDFVHRMIVDPANGHVYAGNTNGVMRSTDDGATWTTVLTSAIQNEGTITDVVRTPNGTYYAAISFGGVWKSDDGTTWNQIATPADLASENEIARIVIRYAPSDENLLYIMYKGPMFTCGATESDVYLRRYNNSTGMWDGNWDDDISECGNMDFKLDLQGGYNMALGVRPNNPNEIFIGGERLYRFTVTSGSTGTYEFAGGDQGNPSDTAMHVDNHHVEFFNDNIVWVGTDGGMRWGDVSQPIKPYHLNAAGNHGGGWSWTIRNTGYITYQFYRGDITPDVSSTMVGGGCQDNANNLIPGPGSASIGTELGGGDGVQFAIIAGTGLTDFNVLTGTQNGFVTRTLPGSVAEIVVPEDPANPGTEWQGFETFYLLDSDNTNHMYYPTKPESPAGVTIFRTRMISTMTSTTNMVTGNPDTGYENMSFLGLFQDAEISALGLSHNATYGGQSYSASDPNRKLYIGNGAGKVYRVSDPSYGNSAAVEITPAGNVGHVSDISVNPYDDKEILVTVSNYGIPSIFHTSDASVATPTWTQVEGPAGSAVALASIRSALITQVGANNQKLYVVGTSTGLYGTTALSGATTVWERIGESEIAYAIGADMRLRVADNKASLASHGNGIFVLNFPCVSMNAPLATVASTSTETQGASTHYASENCGGLIAKVEQSGASQVAGSVTAKVWLDASVGVATTMDGSINIPYVTRHSEIAPMENAGTATGKVTLYFTQAEFDAFNSDVGSTLDLPTGPSDNAGKANLRLTKRVGVSSDGGGAISSYTDSAPTLVDPVDTDIVWNAGKSRWEVSFDVTGFSGFWVHTHPSPLTSEGTTPIINPEEVGKINIYPNPARDIANIELPKFTGKLEIQVVNTVGRLVSTEIVEHGISIHQLDVSRFAHGIYFVRVTDGKDWFTSKLIVARK